MPTPPPYDRAARLAALRANPAARVQHPADLAARKAALAKNAVARARMHAFREHRRLAAHPPTFEANEG